MNKYNEKDWLVFQKVIQEKMTFGDFSEQYNASIPEIKAIVDMWHKDMPEYFLPDSEKESMRTHVNIGRRRKENIEVYSYDSGKVGNENVYDDQVVHKF